MSAPNQKKVRISKSNIVLDNKYLRIDMPTLHKAMNDLSGESFKLWVYFSKNKDGYEMDLTSKDTAQWGIKRDSYYRGIKKLIDKHYLVPIRPGSNIYVFTEIAKEPILKDYTEYQTDDTEKAKKDRSEIQQTKGMEKQERNKINITNNTIINNTKMEQDLNWLRDEVLSDGYCLRISDWLDGGNPLYLEWAREDWINQCIKIGGYNREESEFIVDYILDKNDFNIGG